MRKESLDKMLFSAIANGDMTMIAQSLEKGVSVNTMDERDNSPLIAAIGQNIGIECVRFLIEKNAFIHYKNKQGLTAMHFAAWQNDVEIGELLVANGAKVDVKSRQNRTPLFSAACEGKLEFMKFLVKNGADVHVTDIPAKHSLLHCVKKSNIDAIAFLIDQGANINGRDAVGNTPAHESAQWINSKPLELLHNCGADIHARNDRNQTAIYLAMKDNCSDCAKYLAENGVDPYIQDKKGMNGFDVTTDQLTVELVRAAWENWQLNGVIGADKSSQHAIAF